MQKNEVQSLKFQVGLIYMLMLFSLIITAMLGFFIRWYYVVAAGIPQLLGLWFFTPVAIMEYLDYCWAVYQFNKPDEDK